MTLSTCTGLDSRVSFNKLWETEVGKNRLPFGISWIPQGLSAALLLGTFVLGVGTGVTVDSAVNTNKKDLASRDAIDKNAPNPKFCQVR